VAYFSPLYRELGDALMNVFSRPVVQDRVTGQSLEAYVAGPRFAARGRGASEVVGGKRCFGREEGRVALCTAVRPVPRFPEKQKGSEINAQAPTITELSNKSNTEQKWRH
jgi:hypothetical protein